MTGIFKEVQNIIYSSSLYEIIGHVREITGVVVRASGPFVPLGTDVLLDVKGGLLKAQVVGFKEDSVLLMPYEDLTGVEPGTPVIAREMTSHVEISQAMLGRVIDAYGKPIDGLSQLPPGDMYPLVNEPPSPVSRKRITEPLDLGIRAINALLTIGLGQRVAIMAGSGVGKSTLLGMIARNSKADINVIALVGERGREVREFIEKDLGKEGLSRSVVVVATGDQSPLKRIRAALLATAVAERFRDQGKRVVLMVDSVTRLAMAQREIGLAIGEPPSTKGYTPSVFSLLPKLLERAGTSEGEGAITGIYSVLVEGDDMNEPIADAVRGIVDGHIVLSRKLAGRGHFPAIEILQSISRVMPDIVPPKVMELANEARDILATYADTEDLITIGAYKEGLNKRVDRAVRLYEPLVRFLRQRMDEKSGLDESLRELEQILSNE